MTAPVQVGPSSTHGGPVPFPVRYLTPRLTEVLQLAADGNTNKQIGDALGTTEQTVKSQIKTILRRLHVDDRTHAVSVGIRLGLIRPGNLAAPPTLEQLFILIARAERKGGLDLAEGNRLREGIYYLASNQQGAADAAVKELRRKYENARKDAGRWKQRAVEGGSGDWESREALRRVVELAKRWTHIPAKRQAGASVLAVIENRDSVTSDHQKRTS